MISIRSSGGPVGSSAVRLSGELRRRSSCPPAAQTDATIPNSNRPDITKVAANARESVQAPEVPGLSDVFDSRRLHPFERCRAASTPVERGVADAVERERALSRSTADPEDLPGSAWLAHLGASSPNQ